LITIYYMIDLSSPMIVK